jgi:hypothetical protein
MTKTLVFATAIAAFFGAQTVAEAQTNYASYVMSSGSDASDCSRSTPCASFAGAYGKTRAGGEIICLDKGNFSSLQITRSVTINCDSPQAGLTVATNTVARFEITTAATDRVILRGLDFDIGRYAGFGNSIQFTGAGALILDHVKITGNPDSFNGIFFAPTGSSRLIVTDSLIAYNGGSGGGAGIRVYPSPGGSAQVSLDRVSLSGNAYGIAFDGSNNTAGINATINDSVASGNDQDGIIVTAPSAPIGVTVVNSRSVNNSFGIRSFGTNVTVRVQGSQIIGNGTGLSGSGALLTGGGNTVQANATNGSFTGSYALQ